MEALFMDEYICTVCGYLYNPQLGDTDSGILPNTSFTQITDYWTCPKCEAVKSDFVKK
ncbi:rubredoxin [Geotalea uraniireducens]